MTFWCGSGSGSTDPPLTNGSAYYFLRYIYIIFQRQKVKKGHKIVGIKVFLTIFRMMIEGSGSGSRSIPLINGSGSGRPKNMWIRWIRIRIRIRNNGRNGSQCTPIEDWNSYIHTFSSPWGLTWSQASNPCIFGRLTWTMSALRTSLNTNAAIMRVNKSQIEFVKVP